MCIYILEAHFVEEKKGPDGKIELTGWPIGRAYRYPQHKTIDDRVEMAETFITQYDWTIPTYLDTMSNDFNRIYSAWPDRAFVIHEGKVVYMSTVDSEGRREGPWTNYIEKMFE